MSQSTPPPIAGPKTSGMALAALIVGIAAVPLTCVFGIGIIAAIVSLILGFSALGSIKRNPEHTAGRGMAVTGMLIGSLGSTLVAALFVIFLILPGGLFSREPSRRAHCAANLRGIMQSMVVYSADNNDYYPYRGNSPIVASPPTSPTQPGVMRNVFLLVGSGFTPAQQFICESDPAPVAPSTTPVQISSPGDPLIYAPDYWSPTGVKPDLAYSYSFASPFTSPTSIGTWWRNPMNAGIAITADMNPGSQKARSSKAPFNSLNHAGDGQNIGFADAHVEFQRTPIAGEINDHIYNLHSKDPAAPGTPGGSLDYPHPSAMGSFDIWLVPALTNTSTYDRQ